MHTSDLEIFRAVFAGTPEIMGAKSRPELSGALTSWGLRIGAHGAWVGWLDGAGQLYLDAPAAARSEADEQYLPSHASPVAVPPASIAGRACQTRQLQAASSPAFWPGGTHGPEGPALMPWKSCAALPLCSAGQCVGLLILCHFSSGALSGTVWKAALEQLGMLAGSTLDRHRLEGEESRLRSLAPHNAAAASPRAMVAIHAGEGGMPSSSWPDGETAGETALPMPRAGGEGSRPGDESATDATHLYSPAWEPVLDTLTQVLQGQVSAVVDQFYEKLVLLPKSRTILLALAPAELEHLKGQQIQNIFSLADFRLTAAEHRNMALRIGRIHCIVGLDREELVRSRGLLSAILQNKLDPMVHGRALSVLNRRLTRDLAYQTEAYQFLQDARQSAALRIARLAWEAASYTSLAHGVAEILGQHDEVAAVSVGRPDSHGIIHFEAMGGQARAYFTRLEQEAGLNLTTQADHPQGWATTSRAWQTGQVQRTANIATDSHALPWRDAAMEAGLRSNVAIPLSEPGQPPFAVLTLYCSLPGGYSSADQQAFIELLQTLLGFAIVRIQNLEGRTRAIPYATRRHWAKLLRSDALQLHYQPLFDLRTRRVSRVEMLARLQDGTRLLSPAEFFPTLSPDDFLYLYSHGLDGALRQRRQWAMEGLDLGVSVNLPASALADERYLGVTRRILGRHGDAEHAVMLELLETEALSSEKALCAALERFKSLGVLLAEDDLGSGHSSLSRLRQLPFDWVKIDKSFVDLEGQDPADVLRFVHQLTRLGHSLNKKVAIEGVESLELLDAVAILGVDVAQGYAIARPMPGTQLSAWMRGQVPARADTLPEGALVRLARQLIWKERRHFELMTSQGGFQAFSPAPM